MFILVYCTNIGLLLAATVFLQSFLLFIADEVVIAVLLLLL